MLGIRRLEERPGLLVVRGQLGVLQPFVEEKRVFVHRELIEEEKESCAEKHPMDERNRVVMVDDEIRPAKEKLNVVLHFPFGFVVECRTHGEHQLDTLVELDRRDTMSAQFDSDQRSKFVFGVGRHVDLRETRACRRTQFESLVRLFSMNAGEDLELVGKDDVQLTFLSLTGDVFGQGEGRTRFEHGVQPFDHRLTGQIEIFEEEKSTAFGCHSDGPVVGQVECASGGVQGRSTRCCLCVHRVGRRHESGKAIVQFHLSWFVHRRT